VAETQVDKGQGRAGIQPFPAVRTPPHGRNFGRSQPWTTSRCFRPAVCHCEQLAKVECRGARRSHRAFWSELVRLPRRRAGGRARGAQTQPQDCDHFCHRDPVGAHHRRRRDDGHFAVPYGHDGAHTRRAYLGCVADVKGDLSVRSLRRTCQRTLQTSRLRTLCRHRPLLAT